MHDVARPTIIEQMFDHAGVHIVGVQESRVPSDHTVNGLCYTKYAAGCAPNGSYGTQVWIHDCVKHSLHAVAPHSPRLLEVSVHLDCMQSDLVVFAAHVPHVANGNDAGDAIAFWDLASSALQKARGRYPSAHVLLLVDANAKVGSVTCDHVGTAQPAVENLAGELFRHFLAGHDLFASSSFFESGHTWTGSRGHTSRIDYVVTSDRLHACVSDAHTCDNIDLSTSAREDHKAIAATIDLARVHDMQNGEPCDRSK